MRCDLVAEMTSLPQRALWGITYFEMSSKLKRVREAELPWLLGVNALTESTRGAGDGKLELEGVRDAKSRSERDIVELDEAGDAVKRVVLEDPEP